MLPLVDSKTHSKFQHNDDHAIAVVALGNSLRADDGVAEALLASLPAPLAKRLCLLDAGSYTRDIPEFMSCHAVGIVLDCVRAETTGARAPAPRLEVYDLSDLELAGAVEFDSCHALSWFDELVLGRWRFGLPKRLLFVGVPAYDAGWRASLSEQMVASLPALQAQLITLVERELEHLCTKQR